MATILSGVNLNSTTDGTSFATASFTPAAGDLLVVAVHVSAIGTVPALATSLAGESFTLVETTALSTNTSEIRLYIANQLTTAVARTITYTQTGIATGCYIQALRVAGMTRSGLSAIRQKAETLNAAINARLVMTLPAAALTGNPVCASVLNSGLAPTTPTGWTAIGSLSRATPTMRSAQWAINSGFTGTLVQNETTQNSPTLSSGVAFELDASAAPISFTSLTTDAISPSTFGPFATAVITPAANTLTLACINFNYSAGSGPTAYNLSVTGCGLTWVQVARQDYFGSSADPNSNAALFRAVGPAPTTGALSINSGAPVGMDGASWAIVSVPGADVSNGGANAIVQAVFSATDGATAVTSKTVTMGAFTGREHATFAMVATTLSTSPLTATPTSGMTELGDVSSAWNAMETHYHNGNRSPLTATMSAAALISLLGVEINAAVPIIESTASATGTGTATALSASRAVAAGAASGSGAATALSASRAVAAGAASGSGTATGAALSFIAPARYTAMWSWNESDFATIGARQALVDFAVSRNVTTIIQNAQGAVVSNQAALTALIDLSAASGIAVELLFGDPNWTYTANHQQALDLVTASNTYIAGLTNKPTGYHFDVEPHTLGAPWFADPVGLGGQLIDLYVALKAARSPLVNLGADIALGYKDVNITRSTVTKTLSQWLVDSTDAVTIMSYRDFALGDDSITFHADHPITYATSVGKKAYVGVETQDVGGDPQKLTFFQEGPAVLATELAAVRTYYTSTSGFGGIAIHDYAHYKIAPYVSSANIIEATGAASGAGTATGASALRSSATGVASGLGTASGASVVVVASSASASGLGTASGAAASRSASSASASGLGTASGASVVVVASSASASGSSPVAGAAASRAASSGVASGLGTASGASVASAFSEATASSSGLGTASGAAASRVASSGVASGLGTASAATATSASATGTATGASPTTGTGGATSSAAASASGASVASGDTGGATFSESTASSTGSSVAVAAAGARIVAGASASGASVASAVSAARIAASGAAAGASVASVAASSLRPASAATLGTGAASAQASSPAASSASASGTSSAGGFAASTVGATGAATGSAAVDAPTAETTSTPTDGTAFGSSNVSGTSGTRVASSGSAFGSSPVSGTSGTRVASVGSSASSAVASSDSGAIRSAFAFSSATAAASGDTFARSPSPATGSSVGSASASGGSESRRVVESVGASAGTSTASGATARRAGAVASSAGASSAAASSTQIVSAAASASGGSSATSSGAVVRAGSGASTGASSAQSDSARTMGAEGVASGESSAGAASAFIRSAVGMAAGISEAIARVQTGAWVPDEARTYNVPAERRGMGVAAENRRVWVSAEGRTLSIAGDNRRFDERL